ncbi:MAG: hypothetical protein FWC42_10185 [Proteobacteria bacterium]|nr:hypothetical protein [Pseudomonadota bacterium]
MSFESDFNTWLAQVLEEKVPAKVKAFSFNLFEPADIDNVKFGIELIGAGSFDEDDPDWAADEVWEPSQRWIGIPLEYSGAEWVICLKKVTSLLLNLIQSDVEAAKILRSKKAIGVGFVDGDLEVIWQK